MRVSFRESLPVLFLLAGVIQAQTAAPGGPLVGQPMFRPATAPYNELTNDLTEYSYSHPEPFAGIAIDIDGGILAVNSYNNTWVRYASPTATSMDLQVLTGHNPVSIGVWNPGPTPADRRIVVICTGSHAAFLHDPIDGRILNVLQLDSEPADLEIDHENDRAFVSCRGDNKVVEIDLIGFTIADRYPITCGQRPGPLYLDPGDPETAGDERVYVAAIVTGNNSRTSGAPNAPVNFIVDLDPPAFQNLPDEDIFRINPGLSGVAAVDSVLTNAGSMIFEVGRNPNTGDFWILSTDSNNKGPQDTEPEVQGETVINQLKLVANLDSTSVLNPAPDGIDLDDVGPGAPATPVYMASRSVNQARTVDFQSDGDAFLASPMTDVIARLSSDGMRQDDFVLPVRAQCYAVKVYDPDEQTILALCLGSMTIEVFTEGSATPQGSLSLGNDPTPLQIRKGRDIMLDGNISRDSRSSCFACHEGGRSDQLGWSIAGAPSDLKDVMVTQSLLSIEDTFPHHWRGERAMPDFRKAFVGLLGAPESLAPTEEQMRDVTAFTHALKAPANPIQNFRRVLDDRISPKSPDGFFASAVKGQDFFTNIDNFNGNTCAECHTPQTGSNGNMLFEVGSFVPRAQEVEVAHLRQLQHKGLDTETFMGGGNTFEVNENGFGALHDGAQGSVFRFIFDGPPFVATMTDQQRRAIFEFVEQADQGKAPGTEWATWYQQGSSATLEKNIQQILIQGASNDWLDVVVFGRFHDGTAMREARWLYNPALALFESDDAVLPDQTWAQFKLATQAGLAENAFMGVPWGNGFRIAFDPDFDDLASGDERAIGTDPWNKHSDADRWIDGYEVENMQDPLVAQPGSGDSTFPDVESATVDFVTARVAKWHARFTEDVKYTVEYSIPGGPTHTYVRDYFVRDDTFVLTHSEPSTPIATDDPPALHRPEPDGATVFSAMITMTDRGGNVTGPRPLDETFTPLGSQSQLGLMVFQPGVFPPLGAFVHVAGMNATIDSQGPGSLTTTVTIDTDYHYQDPLTMDYFDAEGRVVVCTVAVEDPLTGDFVQAGVTPGAFDFTSSPAHVPDIPMWDFSAMGTTESNFTDLPGIPGPFVLSPPTVNGSTQITITQMGLTVPGQKVKVAVQGVLIPVEIDDMMGGLKTVYWQRSLFHMQPLLTEDEELDLVGPDFTGTTQVALPF